MVVVVVVDVTPGGNVAAVDVLVVIDVVDVVVLGDVDVVVLDDVDVDVLDAVDVVVVVDDAVLVLEVLLVDEVDVQESMYGTSTTNGLSKTFAKPVKSIVPASKYLL